MNSKNFSFTKVFNNLGVPFYYIFSMLFLEDWVYYVYYIIYII